MTEPAPSSRESLFALLSELARGEPSAERLAAARAAIRSGHLGPPGDANVNDASGRPLPLLAWAARWNDVEMAHLLLERGASPLAIDAARESVLRAAHAHGRGAAIFQAIRSAAKSASERSPVTGLATRTHERRYVLRTERGARDLCRSVESSRGALDVLLLEADLKTAARALANLVQAPRREADVASRPIEDAKRLTFLYRLKGIDWSIAPFVFEAASPWNVEHVPELAAAGTGIAPLARAMARASERRVIHLRSDGYTIYFAHGGIEAHGAEEMHEELAALGVFVPPMSVATDGFHVQLQLFGLDPSDVERVDLVVLQELGDPAVVRTIEVPSAAPAIVGAPVLQMPGLPALVREPPKIEAEPGPAPSEAPPLLREPPPLYVEPGPAPSEAPPLVREPPPLIASAVVDAPSDTRDEAPVLDEPPLSSAKPSAPPPLVREPPMVSAADATSPPDEHD